MIKIEPTVSIGHIGSALTALVLIVLAWGAVQTDIRVTAASLATVLKAQEESAKTMKVLSGSIMDLRVELAEFRGRQDAVKAEQRTLSLKEPK